MYLSEGTIELKVSLFKFLIALLLGGNTGLLGFILRFIWKNYRKYKNAIMMYIEEHEKLVDEYLKQHPEEIPEKYPNYFSRIGRPKKRPHLHRTNSPDRSPSRTDDDDAS